MTDIASGESVKTGLPTWARVLIGLFFIGVITVLAGIGYVAYTFGRSGDSSYVETVTQAMVKIDKLPDGFKYERGIELPQDGRVALITYKDGTSLSLMKLPNVRGDDAKTLAGHLGKGESSAFPRMDVSSEGNRMVAGKDFQYVLGTIGSGGGKIGQLRGVIVLNDKKSAIMITGTSPSQQYNMDATQQFLDAIKGF